MCHFYAVVASINFEALKLSLPLNRDGNQLNISTPALLSTYAYCTQCILITNCVASRKPPRTWKAKNAPHNITSMIPPISWINAVPKIGKWHGLSSRRWKTCSNHDYTSYTFLVLINKRFHRRFAINYMAFVHWLGPGHIFTPSQSHSK